MTKGLFDKTSIGTMKLKNRIFMSPMGTTGEADGAYNIDAINYFMERAKGGTGLIITGANVVSTKYEPRPCTELSDFHHVERLNMLVDRCHHYELRYVCSCLQDLEDSSLLILSHHHIVQVVLDHSGSQI